MNQSTTLLAPDISCQHCVRAIETRLGGLDGVKVVKADVPSTSVAVTYDDDVVSIDKIKEELADEGYPAKES